MGRRPYDLYLRFLLTKGLHEQKEIDGALSDLLLPKVTQADVDNQYNLVFNHVPKPVQKQIETQVHDGDFLKWMKFLEVGDIWLFEKKYKTPESQWIKLVYDIHSDPKLRITIGALILKGVKSDDIVQIVNLKYASMLRKEHVDMYQKFFWNVTKMTRSDWKAYLKETDGFEKLILFACFTEDVEAVKTALDLPSKVNSSEMLQYMTMQAYQKVRQYMRYSSKDTNDEARHWIDVTVKLIDKYEKHRTGDVEDFSKSLQMEFDYIESNFMTPDDQMKSELEADKKKLEEGRDDV